MLAAALAWSALWEPKPVRRFQLDLPAQAHERRKLRQLESRLDNLYEFLESRFGDAPKTPIRVVIHDEASRVDPDAGAIYLRRGELHAMLGSALHELVHLFNFAVPGAKQDFWSGELLAQYHAERLETLGLEHKKRYGALFKDGKADWRWVEQLDENYSALSEKERENLLSLGVSIYWYLEDEHGVEKLACFRRERLAGRGGWESCYGKADLRGGWKKYYGLR